MNSRRQFMQASSAILLGPHLFKRVTREKECLPFDNWQTLNRILSESTDRLLLHRGVLFTSDERRLCNLQVEGVQRLEKSLNLTFERCPIKEKLHCPLTLALYSPSGEVLIAKKLNLVGLLNPGDNLIVTCSINFSGLC